MRRSAPRGPAVTSSAGPAALYRVEGLAIEFGPPGQAHRVLDAVAYEVRAGQTLALVGESGSGKTVSILGPLGLLAPTATVTGTAQLRGRELVGLDEPGLRGVRGREVGVVFQDALAALDPVRTIGAQLDEAVRNTGTAQPGRERQRTVDLLGLVGLPDPAGVAASYPHQLSGGMRQRSVSGMTSPTGCPAISAVGSDSGWWLSPGSVTAEPRTCMCSYRSTTGWGSRTRRRRSRSSRSTRPAASSTRKDSSRPRMLP